jgi:hypothetical protein
VILLATIGAKLTGKVSAGLGAALLLFFIPQISIEGGSAIVGYADFPLSVFYLATIGYLLCACRSDDEHSFRIYAVCLALLPWVKREGVILWFIAGLCGVLVIWRKKITGASFRTASRLVRDHRVAFVSLANACRFILRFFASQLRHIPGKYSLPRPDSLRVFFRSHGHKDLEFALAAGRNRQRLFCAALSRRTFSRILYRSPGADWHLRLHLYFQ